MTEHLRDRHLPQWQDVPLDDYFLAASTSLTASITFP